MVKLRIFPFVQVIQLGHVNTVHLITQISTLRFTIVPSIPSSLLWTAAEQWLRNKTLNGIYTFIKWYKCRLLLSLREASWCPNIDVDHLTVLMVDVLCFCLFAFNCCYYCFDCLLVGCLFSSPIENRNTAFNQCGWLSCSGTSSSQSMQKCNGPRNNRMQVSIFLCGASPLHREPCKPGKFNQN